MFELAARASIEKKMIQNFDRKWERMGIGKQLKVSVICS